MVYTCKYKSLIGDILLAADEIGLTGLWFEGQKYFANTLPEDYVPQETKILTEAKKWLDVCYLYVTQNVQPARKRKNGWMFISPVKNRNLLRHFIPLVQYSDRKCGRFYYRSLTDRRSHMEKLRAEWQ